MEDKAENVHVILDSEDANREGSTSYWDERRNLNRETDNEIMVIAKLQLWDGHKNGYRYLGRRLSDILDCHCGDSYRFFFDGRDIRATDMHHDGTNRYLFREVKSEKDGKTLAGLVFSGEVTDEDIEKHSLSLGRYVCDIYGWTMDGEKTSTESRG